ncbi:MAG: toll/interleukin-1 receptor domain-containing protein [Bacteroidota bacterium]
MEKGIFISYRRADSAGTAGRLKDHLDQAFGEKRVFKDVEDIPAGADFRKVIGHELMASKVILILMGQQYLTLKDTAGNVRIFSEDDYVNIEASTALTFRDQKMVVPVLVNGAMMPAHDQLPDNMKELAYLNAVSLSHQSWRPDVQKLVLEIKKYLKEDQTQRRTEQKSTATAGAATQNRRPRGTSATVPQKKQGSSLWKGVGIGVFAVILFLAFLGSLVDEEPGVDPVKEPQNLVGTAPTSSEQAIVNSNSKQTEEDPQDYEISAEQHEQTEQVPAPPSQGENFQTGIVGTWELLGYETNGVFVNLSDAMSVALQQPVTAREVYTLDGHTIQVSSYVNGNYLPNNSLNYSINGNQFFSSDGFRGTIQYMDRQGLRIYDPNMLQVRLYRRIE